MKQPKKLTRGQKAKLSKKHLDPDKYVVIRKYADKYMLQEKDKIGTNEGIVEIYK